MMKIISTQIITTDGQAASLSNAFANNLSPIIYRIIKNVNYRIIQSGGFPGKLRGLLMKVDLINMLQHLIMLTRIYLIYQHQTLLFLLLHLILLMVYLLERKVRVLV